MFKIYRVAVMPMGLVLERVGFDTEPAEYWDYVGGQWITEYSDEKCLRIFKRDNDNPRNPDFKSQSVSLTSEIFRPGVIGRMYSINSANNTRYELDCILDRSELLKFAGIV